MRKHFLVKPAFQLRHLAWTLGVVTCCCVACYVVFETLLNSTLLRGPLTPETWHAVRTGFRFGFVVVLVIALVVVGIENYFFFHHVAGPLFVLERAMRRLGDGDWSDVIRTRSGDQLTDVIAAFEKMKSHLRGRWAAHEVLLAELDRLVSSPSAASSENLRQAIRELLSRSEKKAA